MRRTHTLLLLIASVAFGTSGTAAAATHADSVANARLLTRWSREALTNSSVDTRQRAIRDLQRAILLDPDSPDPWLTLGRAYDLGSYREVARDCYRNSIRLAPRAIEGYMELGMAWKREWLRTLGPKALDYAAAEIETVVTLRPLAADGWLRLVPLRYERGDVAGAAVAADGALEGRPRRPEALLAVAYVAYRRGDLERADSAFSAAIPRLDPGVRTFFDKPSWIGLRAGDSSSISGGRTSSSGPWSGLDPDPVTPENEFQLEYWSRVAHAYLLFYDPLNPTLDARAETYVRYGPPKTVELNPLGTSTTVRLNTTQQGAGRKLFWDYPVNALVWSYPDLGMRVVLHDQSLNGTYAPALTRTFDPLSVPNQRMLAERGDLASLGNGRAVFPTLPPREQRLDVKGILARFEGERRPRLLAQVQAPGDPGDSMWARAVVLDSSGRELERRAEVLRVSACDPAERRVAEFSSELSAGAFQVAISVRDTHRRRGLYRAGQILVPLAHTLSISDIVLSCANPTSLVGESTVRLEANIEARVSGSRPLAAYFEIYRLTPDSSGQSHFEYEYTVRTQREATGSQKRSVAAPESRVLASTSREETHIGAMRRQFVTIPIQSLPSGRYRLEIIVRDLVAKREATGATDFVRE